MTPLAHNMILMSDVSCRVIISHRTYLEGLGLSWDDFLALARSRNPEDSNLSPEILLDRARRIPWNTFARLEASFDRYLVSKGRADWEESFISHLMHEKEQIFGFASTAGTLFWSPELAYRLNNILIGPSGFGEAVVPSLEKLPDGRLKIELKLAPGCDDSPEFFRASTQGFRQFPTIAGLGNALVESTIEPGRGIYLVTPPPYPSVAHRLWRLLKMPFDMLGVLSEIAANERLSRQQYDRLQKSEAQLREVQNELERKVEERTLALQRRIDEILESREENRELTDRIHQLQKIEAIGTLVGGISHEINNVLHGTFLSIDLAERSLPPDHPARERVLMAKRFTKRGQQLMKQILAFSRKARLESKAIPFLPAVQDAIDLMRSTLPKNISIEVDTSEYDPMTAVMSDPTQLQQIMINLGSNAAYAMRKSGGRLKITIRRRPGENEVVLKVRDNGEGMSELVRSRIFEPFFTTKPQGEGTGVGLSVVHGLITAHGGRIDVTSETGVGTEFTITLPTVALDVPEEDLADLESLGGTESILIVDDETELLAVLADTLEAFGYKVSTAKNADEAIQFLKKNPVDLMLTDYSMPGKTGIDLARDVRRDHPKTKIILCTGYRDIFGSEKATLEIIDAKVSKPLDALTLNREIRACLANKRQSVHELA